MRTFLVSLICVLSLFLICFGISSHNAFFYPVKNYDVIVSCSQKYNVQPSLVASVINVESGFNKNAISIKGAVGLMQILPSTAEWIAGKIGRSDYDLFNENDNIEFGTYFLSYLLSCFQDEKLAICAYNAGQGNVYRWLATKEYSLDGKTLDKIPFKETREYLEKVEKNMKIYQNKFNNVD